MILERMGLILLGVFFVTAGIKYWRIPPCVFEPKSKMGKLIHRLVICAMGAFVISLALWPSAWS